MIEEILAIIAAALAVAKALVAANPTAAAAQQMADALVLIAQKANAAHVEIAGAPIDLALLQPIEPLPEE